MMVNLDYLQRFKKNIILLNTARGEIVPLSDLGQALRIGKVRAAALDVLEKSGLNSIIR
jgi:D-3-phosphoglycerate dehydrogenase